MSLVGKLLRTGLDVVALPLAVAQDVVRVVTLDDDPPTATAEQLERIEQDIADTLDGDKP